MSYVKLFESILDSTVWQAPDHARLVWITLLAMKDRDGVVEASIPGLAHRARVTIPQVEEALALFMSPDPYSRTPDFEGRRIEKVDGGWRLLNSDKYREKLDPDDQREKAAERQQRKRDRETRHASSRSVTPNHAESPRVRHADADADTDPDPDPEDLGSGSGISPVLPEPPDLGAIAGADRDQGEDAPPGTHAKFLRSTQVPHDPEAPRRRRRLITDAWNYAIQVHNQLRVAEGIDERIAEPWPIAPGSAYPPLVELEKRVDEMIAGVGLERAKVKIRNRVDVAATAARRDQTLRWFTPSRMWDPKSFAHDVELSPQQAETRAGPRLVANPRPDPERRPSKRLG